MAEKKKKATKVTYKDNKYKVLDENENKYMLTDGMIHFWVRKEDVKAN